MGSTHIRKTGCGQDCELVIPEAAPPTMSQLDRLSEQDRTLLLRLLAEPVEYVNHDLFAKSIAEELLFGCKAVLVPDATFFVEQHEPELSMEPGETTLSTTQEMLLFQRFNYSRMRITNLLKQHAGKRMPLNIVREMLGWAHRMMEARGLIVQANMPLVLAMAKRTRLCSLDFNELISEGNYALLRSVDKFDCSRGFKFSTYACRAILKSFSRVAMKASRYRGHFPTEFDPTMEKSDFADTRRGDVETQCVDEIRDILAHNRASLNDIEQTVLRERFALDVDTQPAKGKTLEEVGAMIGVTKERVRQIQNKALAKIRSILDDNYLAA